jgi:hypothetical protein
MARLRRNLLAVKNFLFLPDDPSQPLTRFDLIRLKNWMLIGIYLANAISYILMTNLIFRGGPLPSAASLQLVSPFGHLFRGLFFGLGIPVFALIYERPIRRTLNDIFHNRITPLLMAAVRSALRQRSSLPGSTAEIISDLNRQLVADFGKEPIYDIIRDNSSLSANEILNAMIESLKSFQQGAKIEDDITLVIIKICN